MHEYQGSAEPLGSRGTAGAGEPPAAGGPHAAVALPGGKAADRVAETDDIEGTLSIGGESDAGTDGLQRRRAFKDGDLPADLVQGHGGGQSADSAADDDGAACGTCSGHGGPSIADYTCSDTNIVLQL